MKVRRATKNDRAAWDDYVRNHPKASPYHLFGWMEAVKNAYKFDSCSLIAENSYGQITGILPLVVFKIPLHSPVLVSLPYCDVGSILSDTENTANDLLEGAVALAQEVKASSIELREPVAWERKLSFPVERTEDKVRMLLNLPDSSEELWGSFKSKLRSQVKKAEKNGLNFEINNNKIDYFYKVFSQNMRDLGSPVHSVNMISEVVTQFEENVNLGLVLKGGFPIGVGLILQVGNKISIPWASTLRSQNRLNPNMLLYWGLLKFATDCGCTQFDFGRSTPGEGTYRFKSQWGAEPQALVWNRILLEGQKVKSQKGQERLKKWIVSTWKKLPLPVATYCGSKLRKYISL